MNQKLSSPHKILHPGDIISLGKNRYLFYSNDVPVVLTPGSIVFIVSVSPTSGTHVLCSSGFGQIWIHFNDGTYEKLNHASR